MITRVGYSPVGIEAGFGSDAQVREIRRSGEIKDAACAGPADEETPGDSVVVAEGCERKRQVSKRLCHFGAMTWQSTCSARNVKDKEGG